LGSILLKGRGSIMKCKDCLNDLGYKAGMHWPPHKPTCRLGKRPTISGKGELYNRKCHPIYLKGGENAL